MFRLVAAGPLLYYSYMYCWSRPTVTQGYMYMIGSNHSDKCMSLLIHVLCYLQNFIELPSKTISALYATDIIHFKVIPVSTPCIHVHALYTYRTAGNFQFVMKSSVCTWLTQNRSFYYSVYVHCAVQCTYPLSCHGDYSAPPPSGVECAHETDQRRHGPHGGRWVPARET